MRRRLFQVSFLPLLLLLIACSADDGPPVTISTGQTPLATPTTQAPPETKSTPAPAKTAAATSTAVPTATSGGFAYGAALYMGNDPPRAFGMLKAAGLRWARVQVRWEDFEKAPGQIDWNVMDSAVKLADERGIKLLFSVVGTPVWARGTGCGPMADCQYLANFLGQVATRYTGKVAAYEVWNEQNLAREWGGSVNLDSPAKYVQLLKLSYQAIKMADHSAVVVSGGLTPTGVGPPAGLDDVYYTQLMYEAGLQQWADAIGVHANITNNPPDDWVGQCSKNCDKEFKGHPSFYFKRFSEIQEKKAAFGDAAKPIWFTEFGWASVEKVMPAPVKGWEFAAHNSEEDQARYLLRAFELLRKDAPYVRAAFVWNLNYNLGPDQEVTAWSILRPDWSPRPAYGALSSMKK